MYCNSFWRITDFYDFLTSEKRKIHILQHCWSVILMKKLLFWCYCFSEHCCTFDCNKIVGNFSIFLTIHFHQVRVHAFKARIQCFTLRLHNVSSKVWQYYYALLKCNVAVCIVYAFQPPCLFVGALQMLLMIDCDTRNGVVTGRSFCIKVTYKSMQVRMTKMYMLRHKISSAID